MQFVNIGYGNIIAGERIIAITTLTDLLEISILTNNNSADIAAIEKMLIRICAATPPADAINFGVMPTHAAPMTTAVYAICIISDAVTHTIRSDR